MVTLADVARRAGVSSATASRVINGTPYTVAPELRARVLAAVEELQYVPNAHAQALVRSRTATVGTIVHDVSDPYFSELTRGLQRVAAAHGRLVMICNSYRNPERELAYLANLRAQRVEAIVYAASGYRDPEVRRTLARKLGAFVGDGGRVVVIGRHDFDGDAIVPDNEQGAFDVADFLFRQGHRDVTVIAGPETLTTTVDRLAGTRRAADAHGVALPDERVVYSDFSRDGGAAAMAEILAAGGLPTAVVAQNDSMAVGALAALRARGVSVPGDLSLVGFDDMSVAVDVTPSLTTVRVPMVEMGVRAMSLALQPPRDGPRVERFPTELVVRESTAPPR